MGNISQQLKVECTAMYSDNLRGRQDQVSDTSAAYKVQMQIGEMIQDIINLNAFVFNQQLNIKEDFAAKIVDDVLKLFQRNPLKNNIVVTIKFGEGSNGLVLDFDKDCGHNVETLTERLQITLSNVCSALDKPVLNRLANLSITVSYHCSLV